MEERKEEGEAEIQEHGPEHWFSKWERQCLAEAEQDEQLPRELQEEAAAAAQPKHKQQKLWHLFQNSATAVAQLYKDRVCQQPGLSLWVPFQNAATAVTNLYKDGPAAPRALRCSRPWAHLTPRRLKPHLARGQAPWRYAEPATPALVTRL
ncbi:HUWE1-associated protein modifying stress responses-like [Moschus berezovskii]|uniref:HUWE1-associated protein modifying stress responses-like n=1 Tax=Moschus berezovskii TaxID=68408 RepID=UPI002443FB58|nr:HUWE1-associated protein modifying stress responses-like [Moschus berezovskii]